MTLFVTLGAMRLLIFLLCLFSLTAGEVGPASTAVIINGDSVASGTIAREWMRLRHIPEGQAIVLTGIPAGHLLSLADFQQLMLKPIEAELVKRGIAERIALIAYAPDLPTAISFDVDKDAPPGAQSPGAITGMTLLAPLLDGPSITFTSLRANPYAEKAVRPGMDLDLAASADPRFALAMKALSDTNTTEALALFTALATAHPAPSILYNLACMQALTGSLPEAEASLDKAISAGWMDAGHTAADSDLTALRTRPGWAELLKRIDEQTARIVPADSTPFTPIPAGADGIPGRLAMILGNLGPLGLSVAETQAQLAASVAADGSAPRGTVWFMASDNDARTGPRRWAFAAAAKALIAEGVAAEVRRGILPPRDALVVGSVIGIAEFDWPDCGARMVPGAWCDHLTSYGGFLHKPVGQTPLTAFLRAGASGSGGAVEEPLNHSQKFPSAFIHLHRVRGLTLVEALYRSMACPYQYLAVGDPLSRPWPAQGK